MSKDTIYRQDAIDAIWHSVGSENGELQSFAEAVIADAEEEIKALPSAQPERPKGKWIIRDGREDCYECSECHAVIEGDEVYWRNNYFCYHCGAKMI